MMDPETLQAGLRELPEWTYEDEAIMRSFVFPSFRQAIAFVNRIADIAERAEHHPDIDIRYNRVRIVLSTHSAGGVTAKDFDVAHQIDALVEGAVR